MSGSGPAQSAMWATAWSMTRSKSREGVAVKTGGRVRRRNIGRALITVCNRIYAHCGGKLFAITSTDWVALAKCEATCWCTKGYLPVASEKTLPIGVPRITTPCSSEPHQRRLLLLLTSKPMLPHSRWIKCRAARASIPGPTMVTSSM